MFSFLPRDMLFEIMSYITPEEYKTLYLSVNQTAQMDLKQYTMICKNIIANELRIWFEENEIDVQFVQSHEIQINYIAYYDYVERWFTNGVFHSVNDQPAEIIKTSSLMIRKRWYKHGLLHRDNNKPAVVVSNGYCIWYVNGIVVKELADQDVSHYFNK